MKHLILVPILALLMVPTPAAAGTILWHWTGVVTGHTPVTAGARLDSVVPLGTPVDVMVSLDPGAAYLNPSVCLQGTATATLQVLGKSYTNGGFVWEDAMGFGGGVCAPQFDHVEVVAPAWGNGGPPLADGWIPFGIHLGYLPGLWWGGDLSDGQPSFISSQLPLFYMPGQSIPQRFTASLQAVPTVQPIPAPEPGTMALVGIGLALAARQRRRRQRDA